MSEITKPSGSAAKSSNLASTLPPQHLQDRGLAYEDIQSNDACYRRSDGTIALASGAAANAAAKILGYAFMAASAGEAVTLMHDVVMGGYSGLTPGALYYLSASVTGGLATTSTTGGTKACGQAVDATRIRLRETWRD